MRGLASTILVVTAILFVPRVDIAADGPEALLSCEECHFVDFPEAVMKATTPGKHMLERGDGLVLAWNPFRKEGYGLTMAWPGRGMHSAVDASDCSGCHPVSGRGIGHGRAVYPEEAQNAVFTGGADCAVSCHLWLPADQRPGILLKESTGGHGRLFREGYSREKGSASIRFARIGPGCGGCHNARLGRHGSMLVCIDCHEFAFKKSSGLHDRHVGISEPTAGSGEGSACASCHPPERGDAAGPFRAACYNCHPSGHAPYFTGSRKGSP